MAAPVFFSYAWADEQQADRLDGMLRFRGVPVWRDRRAMRFGEYQEGRCLGLAWGHGHGW